MTLQWTFVATVLYVEIFLVSVLLLPFISPQTWQKVFRSRLMTTMSAYSKIYFYIFIAILLLLFAESVRETMKYADPMNDEELRKFPDAETLSHMKLFRAQRNMYIAGFALFLWFILRRLVLLIAQEVTLMAQSEASIRQAQSATATAQQLLDQQSLVDDNKKNSATEGGDKHSSSADPPSPKTGGASFEKELSRTQAELEKTKEELYRARVEFGSMKKQAESTNLEYDRLLKEHANLQKEMANLQGSEDKKGN